MAHILAVDDEPDVCALVRTALERDGHTVRTCAAGGEVTEALCRWADCILLDIMMPGEDGVALCRRIRALTDAPVLFLTAKSEEADVLTALGAGGDDYLNKPFRLAELRARVAAHLRRQQRGSRPARRLLRGGLVFDLGARTAACGGNCFAADQKRVCDLRAAGAAPGAGVQQGADLRGRVRL